jgi:DMSO/TMAO reductase YedYZ molybdopterin-dependent catalytic subunit
MAMSGKDHRWTRIACLVLWISLITAALTGCGAGAPRVDWTVNITGDVANPLALDYGTLVQMEQTELRDILMQKSLGEDEITSWSGVAIETIFERAGVGDYTTATVTAADGYAIEVTKDELEGGIVALKLNGEWITRAEPDKGPVRLVTPETPANRWVFQITEIRVNE